MRKEMKKQYREKETYQNWSVLVSFFSRRGLKIHTKFAEWNRFSWTVSFRCQTYKMLSLHFYLSLASSLSLHVIVRVCMIGAGIFWTGSLMIHKACSSSCWKGVQWKSPPLPFHHTGWQSNRYLQGGSPKASCSQLFSSAKFFFFLSQRWCFLSRGFSSANCFLSLFQCGKMCSL